VVVEAVTQMVAVVVDGHNIFVSCGGRGHYRGGSCGGVGS
jgi:N-methylhydantoinase B/oxoprolinase/acetone carboxylase alpha subunit